MFTKTAFESLNSFASLQEVIEYAKPDVSFWGSRCVNLQIRGKQWKISIDKLIDQVNRIASRSLPMNALECAHALTVTKKIRWITNACDHIIQKRNFITQFFSGTKKTADFSLLENGCQSSKKDYEKSYLSRVKFFNKRSFDANSSNITGTDIWIGHALATGNVNGDAFDDLIIGALDANSGKFSVYVVFGSSTPTDLNSINRLTKPTGVIFNGIQFFNSPDYFKDGYYVGLPLLNLATGDVNGDNKDDIVIAINHISTYITGTPVTYVVFGNENLNNIENLDAISPPIGIILSTNKTFNYDALNVAPSIAVGDMNGDGLAEIAMSPQPYKGGESQDYGKIYVIFGSNNPLSISNLNNISSQAIVIQTSCPTISTLGFSLGMGDINGDKKTDLIITALAAVGPYYNGVAYAVLGNANLSSIDDITMLSPPAGFNLTIATAASMPLSAATGDINADGKADIILGGYQCNNENYNDDKTYLVFGNSNIKNVNLTAMDSSIGVHFTGTSSCQMPTPAGIGLGATVAAGDVNGDGIKDVILSNYFNDMVYVIFGNTSISNINDVNWMPPNVGIIFDSPYCFVGGNVPWLRMPVTTGDMNGDNKNELIIGNYLLTNQTGNVYTIFGNANLESIGNYSNLTTTQGITITGIPNGEVSAFPTPGILCPTLIPPTTAPPTTMAPTTTVAPTTTMAPTTAIAPTTVATTTIPPTTTVTPTTATTLAPTTTISRTPTVPATSLPYPPSTPAPNISKLGTLQVGLLIGLTSGGTLLLLAVISAFLYRRYLRNDVIEDEESGELTPLLGKSATVEEVNQDFVMAELHKSGTIPPDSSLLEQLLLAKQRYEIAAQDGHRKSIYALPELYHCLAESYEANQEDQNAKDYYERSIEAGYISAISSFRQFVEKRNMAHSNLDALFVCHDLGNQAYRAEQGGDLALAQNYLQQALQSDPYKSSLVHLAAAYGCRELLASILENAKDLPLLLQAKDSHGWTPSDLAHIQKNPYAIRVLEEAQKLCERQEKSEVQFQQLLVRLREENSLEDEMNNLEELLPLEKKELHEKILQITNEDLLSRLVQIIKEQLSENIRVSSTLIWLKPIARLIDQCHLPSEFLPAQKSRSRKAIESACHKISDIIKKIKELIEKNPGYPPLILQSLIEIRAFYENFLEKVKQADTSRERRTLFLPSAMFYGASLRHRHLTADARKYLMVDETQQNRDNEYGLHLVREYQGVHYKKNPRGPGVEYMVNSLAQVLIGRGTPPTELIKVQGVEENHIYQASKTVVGLNLDHLLAAHPELLQKIDSKNFSEMIALSLLTDPQDGKPDNYMVKVILDADGEIDKLKIISIDNDIAFADPVVQQHHGEYEGQHYVNVKNVLYFFPQMLDPIDPKFREEFLSLSPEVTVISWLKLQADKNQEYEQLVVNGILNEKELKDLQLPIRLVPKFALALRDKIHKMQQTLRSNQNLTHRDWFRMVEPILQRYYNKIQNEDRDPLKAIRRLYEKCQPSIEKLLEMKTYLDSRQQLMSALAYQQARITDFESNRSQTIQQAMEEFITHLDHSDFEEKGQQSLIAYIQKLYLLENLILKNESLLNRVSLQELILKFPNLKTVSLANCHKLSMDQLLIALNEYPNLTLKLDFCENLSNQAGWRKIAANSKSFVIVIQGVEFEISNKSPSYLVAQYRNKKVNDPVFYEFLMQHNDRAFPELQSSFKNRKQFERIV